MMSAALVIAFATLPADCQINADILQREVGALAVEISSKARSALPGVPEPTIAVYDLGGSDPEGVLVASAASDLLRGALLGLGTTVMPSGFAVDLDLHGAVYRMPDSWLLTGTLWRHNGPLVAVGTRSFGSRTSALPAPAAHTSLATPAPPFAAQPLRPWSWWLTGAVMTRSHYHNPLVGISVRPPSGRWDLGLDAAHYNSGGASPNDTRPAGFIEEDSLEVTALTLRAAYRHKLARLGMARGPTLAFPGALRAGIGVAMFMVTDTLNRTLFTPVGGASAAQVNESGRSTSIHAQPLLEVGLTRDLGSWFELEARAELMGRSAVRQNLPYGGPSFMLRLSCRLWPM